MYATTQQQQHSMYSGSPYHWDQHPLRVSSHDRITVSSHPNDSHWYTDSVLCQALPPPTIHIKTENHHTSSSSSPSPISSNNNKLSSHLLYSPPLPPPPPPTTTSTSTATSNFSATTGPRAVIPSKRAAQNRAAQRAFRQRKERYVKDLEKKAKLMDEWKLELDQLRQQNKELRENNIRLEKQIHLQAQAQQQQYSENKLISPMTSPTLMTTTAEEEIVLPPPVVVVMDNNNEPLKSSRRKIKQQLEHLPLNDKTSFMPINLRAPDQTANCFIGSPTTSCSSTSSSSSSINGLDDISQPYSQLTWPSSGPSSQTTTGDFDSSPYEYETANNSHLGFMNHSTTGAPGAQVLDDLCAVLQTRTRPEISSYELHQAYVMTTPSLPSSSSNMLMSRPY